MDRLKELRKNKHLTLKELSEQLKENGVFISSDSLAKYERGDRKPKIDKLKALADFFQVPVAYLQGTSDISDLSLFEDFGKFAVHANTSDIPNLIKVNTDDMNAFKKEDVTNRFEILLKSIKPNLSDSEFEEINKNVSHLTDISQIENIIFSTAIMFRLALKANTGSKEAQKVYKEVNKIMSDYLGVDNNLFNRFIRTIRIKKQN